MKEVVRLLEIIKYAHKHLEEEDAYCYASHCSASGDLEMFGERVNSVIYDLENCIPVQKFDEFTLM